MLSSRSLRSLAVAASLALSATGCGDAGTAATDEPVEDAAPAVEALTVVATTSILGDIVEQLVQDDGEVTVLMGPGIDPHAYSPSARDAVTMQEADLVVANGLQLEESLLATLEATVEAGGRVFELAPLVDPIGFDAGVDADDHGDDEGDDHGHDDHGHGDHGHGEDDDHAHGPEDPHVWFDAGRMATGIELLAAELAETAPHVDADEWQARAEAYVEQLLEVDAELDAAFAQVPDERRVIITNHDALGYLAARYDLDIVGTVVPGASTQVEANPRQFAELAATVEERGVRVVVADNTDSTRLAEQLANETVGRADVELEVVQVATDALGEPGSPAETYLGLLRETGLTIAETLAAS